MAMPIIKGGRGNYGEAVGILTLDTVFPRIPGDVGNATTFDFPVRFSVVRGASPKRVVHEQDPALLKPFVEAAQELEAAGCRAITTTCGFLALFQREMAAAVGVPLFTSSLMQVPVVYRMLQPGQIIGILTAHSDALNPRVLEAVGADGVPHVLGGSQAAPDFYNVFVQNRDWIDTDKCESQLVALATGMIEAHPQIGAFVCEGTNFSSWGRAIQQATRRPFFDIVTMTRWVYDAVVKPPVMGGFM
jgi:hypothetical protein